MLEAPRLISNHLYINWSGCAPVILALAGDWRILNSRSFLETLMENLEFWFTLG